MCLAPSMPSPPPPPPMPPMPAPPPPPPPAPVTVVDQATIKQAGRSPAEKRGAASFRKPMQTITGSKTGLNPMSSGGSSTTK